DGVIGGGNGNTIDFRADRGVVGGGISNLFRGYIFDSAIAGGLGNNIVGPDSVGPGPLPGGSGDPFFGATIGGGVGNAVSRDYATVPGGAGNVAAGDYSFAAGRRARTDASGQFVWADSRDFDFPAPGDPGVAANSPNRFRARAT